MHGIGVDRRDALRLSAAAARLDQGEDREPSGEVLAELAALLLPALPVALLRELHRYADTGGACDALLVQGLLPKGLSLPPTPDTPLPGRLAREMRRAELTLLAVMSLLGRPFTFSSLYEGRLVQHVLPVPGQEEAQTSGGSGSFLAWHVEDAHSVDRCDHAGLLCLRGDDQAVTLFAPIRNVRLDPAHAAVLREARFVVAADLAHGRQADDDLPAVAVLTGPDDDPELCFDALYQRPADPGDRDAAAALAHLEHALGEAALGHVLAPGDLLVLDNRRVAHARTSFTPRYDGADRWLLRTMTCGSLPDHRRRRGIRAVGLEGHPVS